jgi:hypothetical protein
MTKPLLQPQVAVPTAVRRRPVNWRSVLLGLCGVVFICGLAPYNDFVLESTYLVGNFLPVGVLLVVVVLLAANAPLWRWAPRWALSGGELAVVLGMVLVSCSCSGLMRYLPASMVGLHDASAGNPEYQAILRDQGKVADWLWPTFDSKDPAARANEDVIRHYMDRAPMEGDTFRQRWRAVPWKRWARPAVAWGVLLAGLWGALLCLSVIVRRQWAENERLPFPLATVYTSLIEPPPPGRGFNNLLRNRWLWIAAGAVFFVHGINVMARYEPAYFPVIPLGYNLHSLLNETILRYTSDAFKMRSVYLSAVGITFFLQTKVAFSLWFFFLLYQVARIGYGTYEADFLQQARFDQNFGALVVFGLMMIWVGRHHWMLVLRQMWRGAGEGEPQDPYLSYRAAGWGLVGCLTLVVLWLVAAGATVTAAVVVVMLLLLVVMSVARVVAETGLMFVQIQVELHRPWFFLLSELPTTVRTTGKSFFLSTWMNAVFGHDTRQTLPVYSTHALRIADHAQEGHPARRRMLSHVAALLLALGVGYVVAGASMLFFEYSYGATRSKVAASPLNNYATRAVPQGAILDKARQYSTLQRGPAESHSRTGHMLFGAAVTAVLSALRWRFAHWPLHPIGFLLAYSYALIAFWLSIFVGWLCKVLIVRFGGASLYRAAQPFFIGLILGEAGAAAFWLVVNLILVAMGAEYQMVNLLPT